MIVEKSRGNCGVKICTFMIEMAADTSIWLRKGSVQVFFESDLFIYVDMAFETLICHVNLKWLVTQITFLFKFLMGLITIQRNTFTCNSSQAPWAE